MVVKVAIAEYVTNAITHADGGKFTVAVELTVSRVAAAVGVAWQTAHDAFVAVAADAAIAAGHAAGSRWISERRAWVLA